jgi:glycosyltransferase involved in cell wall biosynthesis
MPGTDVISVVVPLYKSEANLPSLFRELSALAPKLPAPLEVVFVIDGSPDRCEAILADKAPSLPFRCQVISLSRNFGAFAAIKAGLQHGTGNYFAVLAADLQEPPELVIDFVARMMQGDADIVFGVRTSRSDPLATRIMSFFFWAMYRRIVNSDIPRGGVDVFACTEQVRNYVTGLNETESSLIALLFWVGFRRAFVPYERRTRTEGKSAWRFWTKVRYAVNSIFNFTDVPIRLLFFTGSFGMIAAIVIAVLVLVSRLLGYTQVPGYTPIVLTVVFFGGLTALGLGIVGQYIWLALQNSRQRPNYIVRTLDQYRNQ